MPGGHRYAAWNGQAAGGGRHAEPPVPLFPLVSTMVQNCVSFAHVALARNLLYNSVIRY